MNLYYCGNKWGVPDSYFIIEAFKFTIPKRSDARIREMPFNLPAIGGRDLPKG
jgi:hypothetical protein